MSSFERAPGKRKLKQSDVLVTIDDLDDSSDDSDFVIDENCDENDSNSDEEEGSDDSDENTSVDESSSDLSSATLSASKKCYAKSTTRLSAADEFARKTLDNTGISKIAQKVMVCYVCLGEKSDESNEIVECDSCGATVHEGCYGVQDSCSVSSDSSSSTSEPWFCEPCRAGVFDPPCELCPNFGGILKETDAGRWVHLICALYIPGVAFTEADKLTGVTLSEIPHTKWGSEICVHCADFRVKETGLTIQCDMGLCRTYFHATCAQMEGLLIEANVESQAADPYYAHCKYHSDKVLAKRRKFNWERLEFKREEIIELRKKGTFMLGSDVQMKLEKYREKYRKMRLERPPPFVPKDKVPRCITTSATAVRMLWRKSEAMEIDMVSIWKTQALIDTLMSVPKKWNVDPAVSYEFVTFYISRKRRIVRMREEMSELRAIQNMLAVEMNELQITFETVENKQASEVEETQSLAESIKDNQEILIRLKNRFSKLMDLDKYLSEGPAIVNTDSSLRCSICRSSRDPHLMAICDTCNSGYHLGCLDPPLIRMPKKTKLLSWQCSECDKNDADDSSVEVDPEEPRKLRNEATDDDSSVFPTTSMASMAEAEEPSSSLMASTVSAMEITTESRSEMISSGEMEETPRKSGKKRRREKHRDRYSPELIAHGKHHSRKKRHKSSHSQSTSTETTSTKHKRAKKRRSSHSEPSMEESPSTEPKQPIKLVIKTIPNPNGEGKHHPQLFVATDSSTGFSSSIPPSTSYMTSTPVPQKRAKTVPIEKCSTCRLNAETSVMVKCDECFKHFHFGCLDPPVRKSPKVRGYSWHCADCDPTDSDTG